MKKVFILLSAFNGEQYITQQLDSLLAQDYPEIVIHVRDDGSTDHTVQILRTYEAAGKIRLYEGENLGFIQSFNWLLRNCTGADYYAWCDQDDVWKTDKVSVAVQALSEAESRCVPMKKADPILYVSDFYWANAECKPARRENAAPLPHTLEKRLIRSDLHGFGFAQMFNEACAKRIREKRACRLMPHDDTVYLYCLCCGKVLWGEKPEAWFRRYGNNTSGQEKKGNSPLAHLHWQIHYFLFEYSRDRYYDRAGEFYQIFREDLPESVQKRFELYLHPGHRMKKAFYRGRYRDHRAEDLATRILFLMGRL